MTVNEPVHQQQVSGREGQYLSFTLADEDYGVDILRVQEIRGWEEVRPLPDTPDYIKGVLDLRGVIVPIVDLRIRLNMSRVEYTATTVIIVLAVKDAAGASHLVGAVVDGVSDVLDVDAEELRKVPSLGCRVNQRYLLGMLTRESRMVILLDVDKLFESDELGLLQDLS